jgi:hypothetical protein
MALEMKKGGLLVHRWRLLYKDKATEAECSDIRSWLVTGGVREQRPGERGICPIHHDRTMCADESSSPLE